MDLVQILLNGVVSGSGYAIIALGFSIIYGTARFFHLAHAAVYTSGAYLAYLLAVQFGMPFLAATLLALVLTAGLGITLDACVYRPLRQRGATSLMLLVAALGAFTMLQNVISITFGDATRTFGRRELGDGVHFAGVVLSGAQLAIVITSFLLFVFSGAVLRFTRFGKAARAVAEDAELSELMGIDSQHVIRVAFGWGSLMAGAAAIVISLDYDLNPYMGFMGLLSGVVAAVVGGIGSLRGALIGGLLLGVLQHLGGWVVGTRWQDTIAFLVLLAVLAVRPAGLLGDPPREVRA